MGYIGRTIDWTQSIGSDAVDLIVENVKDGADWVVEQVEYAFGAGTPLEQMLASFGLGVAAFGSTAITAGATIFIVFAFAGTFLWGFARLTWDGATYISQGG